MPDTSPNTLIIATGPGLPERRQLLPTEYVEQIVCELLRLGYDTIQTTPEWGAV